MPDVVVSEHEPAMEHLTKACTSIDNIKLLYDASPGHILSVRAGLEPNEAYMFAVAAFDAHHKLVSELGLSAGPVAALLPLPLYHCWCHLALTAAQLGASKLCHAAAAAVIPHFITAQPDRPVWEASPLDAQQLDRCSSSCRTLCKSWCSLCAVFVQVLHIVTLQACLQPWLLAAHVWCCKVILRSVT